MEYGYGKAFGSCNFEVLKKDRLGIIGENGCGKSTILKTIMGIVPKINGDYQFGNNVTVGYFDQELKNLDDNKTIYEEFASKNPEMNDFLIRKSLGMFLFSGEDVNKKIGVLSGGEKVRLELCEVIAKKPNFLILDEPTNHLDILMIDKLEDILTSYPGTILFVSHDRMFISKLATALLVVSKDEAKYYHYTYKEYLDRVNDNQEVNIKIVEKKDREKIKNNLKNEVKEIKKIELEIKKQEEKLNKLKESLYDPLIYNDYVKVNKVNNEIKELEKEIEILMVKWEEFNLQN